MITPNPFVGPRTFSADEADRYYGREREARELYFQVVSQRLVLFYAQSGAGKSSLLRTRLMPRLKADGFAVLPYARVGGRLPDGLDEVDNIYVFNLLLRLDQGGTEPERLAKLRLADFMDGLSSEDGETYTWSEFEADVPDEAEETPIHVLIIDQFEEVVTNHPHRWQEREGFFRQLDEAMQRHPKLWVLLCFREDYLAAMDPFAPLMADKMRAQYYMQRLGREAALEAMSKPAAAFGRPFAPGCAEQLADQLREINIEGGGTGLGQFVEPVQLQVVCYQLWQNLADRPPGPITTEDLKRAGDVDLALSGFYNAAVVAAVEQGGATEITVRDWFEKKLITSSGTRGTVHQGPKLTEGLPNEMVFRLADRFLLRPEYRAGDTWFELIHDRLVDPILAANRDWLQSQDPLVRAAHAWNEGARSKAHLLAGRQLDQMPDLPAGSATRAGPRIWPWVTAALLIGVGLSVLARLDLLGDTLYRWTRAITEFLIPGSGQ